MLDGTLAVAIAVAGSIAAICISIIANRRRYSSAAGAAARATAAPADGDAVPYSSAAIGRDMARLDGELKAARDRIDAPSASIPRGGEVDDLKKSMDGLCADFGKLGTEVNGRMEAFRRATADDLDKSRLSMEKAALEAIVAKASALLEKNGVPRAEFDALLKRFDRMHGADESEERMAILSRIFESDKVKVINWQCRLIRLLRGGLAPDAEWDMIVSEGIPESAYKKFLKRLDEYGIVETRYVPAYYMGDDYEWIYTYTDRPDWLHRRLQGVVKREADYQ